MNAHTSPAGPFSAAPRRPRLSLGLTRNFTGKLALSLVAGLLAGCASPGDIAPRNSLRASTPVLGEQAATLQGEWPQQDWWLDLKDEQLNQLIEQALRDSPTLQLAAARLARAEAASGVAEASRKPRLDATLSSTRQKYSEHGLTPPPYAGNTYTDNNLQLAGQWELDFFSRHGSEFRAALGEWRASAAETQAARLLLANDVARSYYRLAQLLAQRQALNDQLLRRGELAALSAQRLQVGLDNRGEFEGNRGPVPENARDIAALDEQILQTRHALAALLGSGPDATAGLTPTPAAVSLESPLASALPAQLPADLLGHRADVVAARWRVEASVQNLAAARAQFYPNINLRAFIGYTALGTDHWLEGSSRNPGLGVALSLPLFDAGRLRNQYRSSAANVDQAIATYNAALLEAVRDAADQISAVQTAEAQLLRQQAALHSAEQREILARQRYQAGISDRMSLLTAETQTLGQRRTLAEIRGRWMDARLRLIRALGGGYQNPEALPDTPVPGPAQS